MAAWPAAVAASLDRFLSASGVKTFCLEHQSKLDNNRKLTSFLFPLNLCYYFLHLAQLKILRHYTRI